MWDVHDLSARAAYHHDEEDDEDDSTVASSSAESSPRNSRSLDSPVFSPSRFGAPSAKRWDGAVVVLEGPIGCGKSCILKHAIDSFAGRKSHSGYRASGSDMDSLTAAVHAAAETSSDTLALCAAGDPFYRTLYLGVWRTILMNFLSEEARIVGQDGEEGQILQRLFQEHYPLLLPWLGLLAQLLPLSATDAVPESDQSRCAFLHNDDDSLFLLFLDRFPPCMILLFVRPEKVGSPR